MKITQKRLNSVALLGLITVAGLAQGACEETSSGEQSFTLCKVWPAYDDHYSDAVAYEGLAIDTARYKLTPDDRAFGIRSSFEHNSSVSPYYKTELALYLREGDSLRPVLEGLVISTGRGEWDGNCAGQGEKTQRTLDIGKTLHNGFADLVVTSTVTVTESVVVGEACKDTSKTLKPTRITLNYDGKRYVVPEALKG